jgi:protein-S-isoprenylcysteine O-methyltransferase Ste14
MMNEPSCLRSCVTYNMRVHSLMELKFLPTAERALLLLPSTSMLWLSRLRATPGYDAAVGAIGSAWFLVLAVVVGLGTLSKAEALSITDFSQSGWQALLPSVCMFLFYLALWWLMLVRRPSPTARTDRILPSLIAFVGSYLPWTFLPFAQGDPSETQNIASAALSLIGTALMAVVICYLGRSFSIVPQARKLVRTGPYAIVRNPLYFAEEAALLGTLVQFFSLLMLALFLAHGVLQIGRILYEESLLRRTFPGYDDYAKSTSRLIPYIW